MKRMILLSAGLLMCRFLFAANVENMPHTITQPNGKVIHCLISGDEFYHRIHDANGYTIILNTDNGYFYYGVKSGETVVPSKYLAGTVNPAKVGLEKWAMISERLYAERRAKYEIPLKSTLSTPNRGQVNGLCIYIAFADDSVFSHNRKYFREMWSAPDKPSVEDYYRETSYQQLDLRVSHFPVSPDSIMICYKDIHPRNYYKPKSNSNPGGYSGDESAREQGLLKRAVDFVANQIPADLNIDMNNDGQVDNISFIIQGTAVNEDWSNLLWPHQSSTYGFNASIKGAEVRRYFLTLENFGVYVICHELGHIFGAPDLYHYTKNAGPNAIGSWCLMCDNDGAPKSICGFLKYKYNHWISDLPEITESGVYSLKPLSEPINNLYMIKSPYSRTEYFVLEYRRKTGRYESSAPGTGLVVYRINPGAGSGNKNGPPDEVYIYRPGGTITEVGSLSSAAMFAPARTAISDKTDPYSFLWNNGESGPGRLDLFNVSAAGDSITFEVKIEQLFPPTELEYSQGTGIVDLTWQPSLAVGLQTYFIYRNGERYANTTFSTFRDTGLVEGQTYSYKVSAYYSGEYTGESVKSNQVTYTPKGIQVLPYKEDFEQIGHGWKIKDNVEGFQWGDATSLAMQTTNTTRFLGANSVAAGLNTVCSDYAITPRLDLAGKTRVFLHFDYALKRWQQLDHLKVFSRKNRNEGWVLIIDLPVSPIGSMYRWKKYTVEIPADCYTAEAQVGFQYDDGNDYGYGAAIDNVVIDEEEISGIEASPENLSVDLYPNPASEKVYIRLNFPGNPEVSLQLCDLSGKILLNRKVKATFGTPEAIDLSHLPQGVYNVIISRSDEVIIKQLIKQ